MQNTDSTHNAENSLTLKTSKNAKINTDTPSKKQRSPMKTINPESVAYGLDVKPLSLRVYGKL
jgi:hypothetical protein